MSGAYHHAIQICREAGMVVNDEGLCFTTNGRYLTNGDIAPEYLQELTGADVWEVARAILEHQGRQP